MKKRKVLFIVIAVLLTAIPAFAVFNEKDLAHTLSVLRYELFQQNQKVESSKEMLLQMNEEQHQQMIDMVKKCNELSLILFSQNAEFTFDLTYALREVRDKYEDFSSRRKPYDDFVDNLNIEIDRYQRLIESLRRLPPALDEIEDVPDSLSTGKDSLFASIDSLIIKLEYGSVHEHFIALGAHEHHHEPFMLDEQSCIDRDSCIHYARNLLFIYTLARDQIVEDNQHYADMNDRLKDSYDYAQKRYRTIQNSIFRQGQDSYFYVLKNFRAYVRDAFADTKQKYSRAYDFYDDGCKVEEPSVMEAVAGALTDHNEEEHEHEHELELEHELEHELDIDADHEHEHEHVHRHMNQSEWRGPVVSAFIVIVVFLIILASTLSAVIVLMLNRFVKRFRTEEFRQQRPCILLLAGMVVFAITIMVANQIIHQNFIVMACKLLLVFVWLVSAILVSILIRVSAKHSNRTLMAYAPMILTGLIVITFRIIFIPNLLVNLIFPPLMLLITLWQFHLCHKGRKRIQKVDRIYTWLSLLVMVMTTIISWKGYVLLAVQAFIWWLFQLSAILTITAFYELLSMFEKKFIADWIKEYRKDHVIVHENVKGAFIEVTWLFDLIKDAAVPICAVLSIPFSIWLAADVFDLTESVKIIFFRPFFNITGEDGNAILHISLFGLLLGAELFFAFRYVEYIIKALYRTIKYENAMKRSGVNHVHTNEINLTLANNLISIMIWGIFIITLIVLFRIPMGAISIVAAGLATGIGLALKDVLNNFIYGIQLMSGRLRVGDYIDCDGIRGKVESISYQSTQIHTLDGSIMAITNTALFNKNFKNLTKNNSYELVKIPVGVHYGVNVAHVRDLLTEALKQIQNDDMYGRPIVDPSRGITIAFNDFGDSSVDLIVKQYVLVENEAKYIADAKEIIYNTLNANNIEIPYPQRDIYIHQAQNHSQEQ
ncbi:MAG: mechanosensitive ion channel family protein [Bacteroidales bacterium]|nr:mechanosensitive ion channel family protein [Bacteroidales bacterium]